ncbi:putative exosortase-associated protein, TIGR04073 family [Nitrosomonas aestuarii]|uniref:Putative exosortase-associated protein, TIGR04073 family n=1 Tax=Nitrosomonas aestuarii TaxID=52441 RepID=A0A1I4AT76_9PROT|nr:exosortase system-associated protein, TIGR04073 family [Nitrosomonas aestuarii]SFK59732.1 putative exosortase-associated protein, TIGR04073 family [Nitrosomonas aestuarii]
MGKMTKLILMLLLFFFLSSHAVASERYGYGLGYGHGYIGTSSEKFVTGIVNAATGFVELPKNIVLTTHKDTVVHGMTIGLVSGVMHTVARTVIGVFDVATFFIPTPPSIQPPFVWQDFSVETSY